LFDLTGEPNPAVITVRFKAVQNEGFLASYGLTVRKGNFGPPFLISTTTGPLGEASGALSNSYVHGGTTPCGELFGTRPPDEPLADASDYVTAYIIPTTGNWLAVDQTFCTFSLNVGASMRRTNGYNTSEDGFGPVQYLLGIQQ